MARVRRFLRRLLTLFRSGRAESELSREIDAHLQLLEDDFVAKGMTRREARYAAQTRVRRRRADEGTAARRARVPLARGLADGPEARRAHAGQDARPHGGRRRLARRGNRRRRRLARIHPRPAAARRSPSPDASRIVGIRVVGRRTARTEGARCHDFAIWRANATTHRPCSAPHASSSATSSPATAEPTRRVASRSAPLRSASCRRPAPRPRHSIEDDERPGAPPVAVIGHELWQARFDGDPNVIGRAVHLGSDATLIAGVMPRRIRIPGQSESLDAAEGSRRLACSAARDLPS